MFQFLFKSEENLIFEGKDYIHLHAEAVINTVFKFLFFLYIYIYIEKKELIKAKMPQAHGDP